MRTAPRSGRAGRAAGRSRAPAELTVAAEPRGRTTVITLSASGGTPVRWWASAGAAWLQMSHTAGTLLPGESTTITVYIDHDREPHGPLAGQDRHRARWHRRHDERPWRDRPGSRPAASDVPASEADPAGPEADAHADPDVPVAHAHVAESDAEADRPGPVLDTVEHDASGPLSAPGGHRSRWPPGAPVCAYFCGFCDFFGGRGSAGCGAIGSVAASRSSHSSASLA